jgi:uncharacterized YigZ family protein
MSKPSPRYPIPSHRFRSEIEVERSRFITTVHEAASPEAAQAFISELKTEFPDANHNCWAYLIGPPGSTDRIGLSDDGEPHGVAGRPMLTTLQHSGLGDTVVVVTRYFGGIKLGKGGMVKAYTLAVQTALQQLSRTDRIAWVELTATFDYSLVTPLERRLPEFEVESLSTDYSDKVCLSLRLPEEQLEGFEKMFTDLTAGQGLLKKSQARPSVS